MLDGFDFTRQASTQADMRNELLQEADDAFRCADRDRCIDVIERIYEFFDDNID